ncbi:hypothetical protein SprV_0802617900 [Sparganum proliferum]
MEILSFIFLIFCLIGRAFGEQRRRILSNGLHDNVVTSVDLCQSVLVNLPEPLKSIELDKLHFPCDNQTCGAKANETIKIEYNQVKGPEGRHYQVSARFCKHNLTDYFRIGWEVEQFARAGRKTLLTQFIVPEGNWSVNNISCIQPQYSLPLIRFVNESSQVTVQCTIRKSMRHENESIVIFDLDKVFCVYNETVQTCNKTEGDDDIVNYTTAVSNTATNKYFPDQYIFYQKSTIVEESKTTTLNPDDQCSCPTSHDTLEFSSCKRNAVFECSGSCRG